MRLANDVLASLGFTPDYLADHTSDSGAAAGERNTRHDGIVDCWRAAADEAIPQSVFLCTKGNKKDPAAQAAALARYADLNTGHVPDFGARRAAKGGTYVGTRNLDPMQQAWEGKGRGGGNAPKGDGKGEEV